MENISSLNSPHIARVKALLGPRAKKAREQEGRNMTMVLGPAKKSGSAKKAASAKSK